MHNSRWRLSNELILWHSIALVLVCLFVGLFSYHTLLGPLELQLPKDANQFAAEMVAEIREPLWQLNSGKIQEQIEKQHLNPSLLDIRVENQFGDQLGEWKSPQANNLPALKTIKPVFWNDELIGNIHVSWSRQSIVTLRDSLWPAIFGITAVGIAVQLILTWFLARRFIRRPLFEVVKSMRNTARGNYDNSLPTSRHQEIRLLHKEAKQMAERIRERTKELELEVDKRQQIAAELMQHRHNLEQIVRVRTQELDKANQSLRDEMAQRKVAQKTIIQVSTHEQQRIGQDLHDTLGQEIVGARYLLSSLERAMAHTEPQYRDRLQQLSTMLHDIMEHARMLAHGLMVVDLNEGGLQTALEAYARKIAQLFGIRCRFRLNSEVLPELDDATSIQLYYIAQEAVTNAIRHGKASRIRVLLGFRRGQPCLQITDNGGGFENAGDEGTGLIIMRSRTESFGGRLTVWSRLGLGSCIRCCIPSP